MTSRGLGFRLKWVVSRVLLSGLGLGAEDVTFGL